MHHFLLLSNDRTQSPIKLFILNFLKLSLLNLLGKISAQVDEPVDSHYVRLNPELFGTMESAVHILSYSEAETEIENLFHRYIYEANTVPVYYTGSNKVEDLKAFPKTATFQTLKQQLQKIEEKLVDWLHQHPVTVSNTFTDPLHPERGLQTLDASQTLQFIFNEFQQLGKQDDPTQRTNPPIPEEFSRFSAQKYFIWGQTKKHLERLTALLYSDRIAYSDKQSILLHLFSNNALLLGSAECIEQFSLATQALKNSYPYQNFIWKWHQWIRNFIQMAVDTSSHRNPISISLNYAKLLCTLRGIHTEANERHAHAFLHETARQKYPILLASIDPSISLFNTIDPHQKTELIHHYLKEIQQQINPTDLTEFLARTLHHTLTQFMQTEVSTGILYSRTQAILDSIGLDNSFELGSVINTEVNPLQLHPIEHLKITLIERLIQKGHLQLPNHLTPHQSLQSRTMPGAIRLAWITIHQERKLLLTALKDETYGTRLSERLSHFFPQKDYPLDLFIGNTQDLYTLIEILPTTEARITLLTQGIRPTHLEAILMHCDSPLLFADLLHRLTPSERQELRLQAGNPALKNMIQAGIDSVNIKNYFPHLPELYFDSETQIPIFFVDKPFEARAMKISKGLIEDSLSAGLTDLSDLRLILPKTISYYSFEANTNHLSGLTFRNIHFEGTEFGNLYQINFENCYFSDVCFGGDLSQQIFQTEQSAGHLMEIQFKDCFFNEVTFGGDLSKITFQNNYFHQVFFKDRPLNRQVKWQEVQFQGDLIESTTFENIHMSVQTLLDLKRLGERNFKTVVLYDSVIPWQATIDANFFQDLSLSREAFLFFIERGIKEFRGINLNHINLEESLLGDINLFEAQLNHANLERSDLKFANLCHIQAKQTNFKSADLSFSRAEDANFYRANFLEARLEGVVLHRANLRFTHLSPQHFPPENTIGTQFNEPIIQNGNPIQKLDHPQAVIKVAQKYLKKFPEVSITSVNQGLYLSVLQERGLAHCIQGKCVMISLAFSRSLLLGEATVQQFLNNLKQAEVLYTRVANGFSLSAQERQDLDSLNQAIDSLYSSQRDSVPTDWKYPDTFFESIKTLPTYLRSLNSNFILHLDTKDHVIVIYRRHQSYGYFDSNLLWAHGFKNINALVGFMAKVSPALNLYSANQFSIERIKLGKMGIVFNQNTHASLWKPLLTEAQRLSVQDAQHGYLQLKNPHGVTVTLSRIQLYHLGLCYHPQGLENARQILDANCAMDQMKLNRWLGENRLSFDARAYAKGLKQWSKTQLEPLQKLFQATQTIPVQGSNKRLALEINQLHAWAYTETPKPLLEYYLQRLALISAPPKKSRLEAQNTPITSKTSQKWVHAGGAILLTKATHHIVQSLASEKTDEFLQGLGELSLGVFSQSLENQLVKLTPRFIKQAQLGLRLTRGTASIVMSPFDLYDFIQGIHTAYHAIPDSPLWQEAIATSLFSGGSLAISAGLVILQAKPILGVAAGVLLMTGQGLYTGIRAIEHFKKSDIPLTSLEILAIFHSAFLNQELPQDLSQLQARKAQLQTLIDHFQQRLKQSPEFIIGIASGLGVLQPYYETQAKKSSADIAKWRCPLPQCRRNKTTLSKTNPFIIQAAESILDLTHEMDYTVKKLRIEPMTQNDDIGFLSCLSLSEEERANPNHFIKEASTYIRRYNRYKCDNAFLMTHRKRWLNQATSTQNSMIIDLALINKGKVIGSAQYHNIFNLYEGTAQLNISSGSHTHNQFMLNTPDFRGNIYAGFNATHQLNLASLQADCLLYANNRIKLIQRSMTCTAIQKNPAQLGAIISDSTPLSLPPLTEIIGRAGLADYIQCTHMPTQTHIIPQGGLSPSLPDILMDCQKSTLQAPVHFYAKLPGQYRVSISPQPGNIRFYLSENTTIAVQLINMNLLDQTISYQASTHILRLQPNTNTHPDIQFHLHSSTQLSLLDQNSYWIEPVLETSDQNENWIPITQFTVYGLIHPKTTLGTVEFEATQAHYQKLLQTAKPEYSITAQFQANNSTPPAHYFFGSPMSDSVSISKEVKGIQANEGRDFYQFELTAEEVNISDQVIILNNEATDQLLDILNLAHFNSTQLGEMKLAALPRLHACLAWKEKCLLLLWQYFKHERYRHLLIQDKEHRLWISDEKYFNPYYGALTHPQAKTVEAAQLKLSETLMLETNETDLHCFRKADDLCLGTGTDALNQFLFLCCLKDFYSDLSHPSPWESVKLHLIQDSNILNITDITLLSSFAEQIQEPFISMPLEDFNEKQLIIQTQLSKYSVEVANWQMLLSLRHSLTSIPQIAACLGFESDEMHQAFIQGYLKSYLDTPQTLKAQMQKNLAQYVPSLIWIIANAMTLEVPLTILEHCFDLLSPAQLKEINQILNSNASYLGDWIETYSHSLVETILNSFEFTQHENQRLLSEAAHSTDAPISAQAPAHWQNQALEVSVISPQQREMASSKQYFNNYSLLSLGAACLASGVGYLGWLLRRRYHRASQTPLAVTLALLPLGLQSTEAKYNGFWSGNVLNHNTQLSKLSASNT